MDLSSQPTSSPSGDAYQPNTSRPAPLASVEKPAEKPTEKAASEPAIDSEALIKRMRSYWPDEAFDLVCWVWVVVEIVYAL